MMPEAETMVAVQTETWMLRMDRGGFLRVCVGLLLLVSSVQGAAVPERNASIPDVSMAVGGVRITNEAVELRCVIHNDSEQDIWIYRDGPDARYYRGRTNATLFMNTDGETLVVLRRMNVPDHGFADLLIPPVATYDRLSPGGSLPETLRVDLPVNVTSSVSAQGFVEALGRGVVTVKRLAFEIGYYSGDDLQRTKARPRGEAGIRFSESGDQVYVCDLLLGALWQNERVVRVTVDGLCLPLREWLVFERDPGPTLMETMARPFHNLAAAFRIPTSGHVAAGIPGPDETMAERLEDMFFGFSIGLYEYSDARRLFSVDKSVWNDEARAMADVYRRFVQGRLTQEMLPWALYRIGPPGYRGAILKYLESRQQAVTGSVGTDD